jgi:hypothetical protein
MEESAPVLPYVDEHSVEVRAPRDLVWHALDDYVHGSVGISDRHPLGVVLGTRPRSGFAVAATVPGEQVALEGRHRFSVYRLVFDVADGPSPGMTTLRATTLAAFPGPHGRAYRLLVISSRAHVVATTRMLRVVARRAEAAGAGGAGVPGQDG